MVSDEDVELPAAAMSGLKPFIAVIAEAA
ncbi:hypothetical protein A2U01_0019392, partial [Trifolium medium]|nr:hypothetical protein [Trifolium medium]